MVALRRFAHDGAHANRQTDKLDEGVLKASGLGVPVAVQERIQEKDKDVWETRLIPRCRFDEKKCTA